MDANTVLSAINALIVLFPTLSLLYSLIVVLAYVYLLEFEFTENKAKQLLLRLSFWMVCVAHYYNYDDGTKNPHKDAGTGIAALVLYAVASIVISCRLMRHTRIDNILDHSDERMSRLLSSLSKRSKRRKLVVLITGANAGIGYATVEELIKLGKCSKIILACRNETATKDAIGELLQKQSASSAAAKTELLFLKCDLSSLRSVKDAVCQYLSRLLKEDEKIDVLINNAGILMHEQTYTKDGFEFMMQVNVIGHYFLTRLLLDNGFMNLLSSSSDDDCCRILTLTSSQHKYACRRNRSSNNDGGLCFDDLHCLHDRKHRYTMFGQYSQTKLANIYLTQELLRRYKDSKLLCYSIHPGIVGTLGIKKNLHWSLQVGYYLSGFVAPFFEKTPAQGAWSTVYCATMTVRSNNDDKNNDDDENKTPLLLISENGSYVTNCRSEELHPIATRAKDAQKLWELCEEWTKPFM